jgi:hypothetical protein
MGDTKQAPGGTFSFPHPESDPFSLRNGPGRRPAATVRFAARRSGGSIQAA